MRPSISLFLPHNQPDDGHGEKEERARIGGLVLVLRVSTELQSKMEVNTQLNDRPSSLPTAETLQTTKVITTLQL